MLLPHLAGVVIEAVEDAGAGWRVRARGRAPGAACPRCGSMTRRVQGSYERHLVDAAIGGRPLVIDLMVRRWRCREPGCPVVTFAEQVPGLTSPHARYTPLAAGLIEALGLALAGRAGARLAAGLGLPAGRDTLLRRVRGLPDPPTGQVSALGVDDFALRRGQNYATILIDMDTHRPVEVLPGREGVTFAAWLTAHPGVKVICRDRAGSYAVGGSAGAPDAVQVADRYHLWANLAEAVKKTIAARRDALHQVTAGSPVPAGGQAPADPTPAAAPESTDPPPPDAATTTPDAPTTAAPQPAILARTRDRYTRVHALLADGASHSQIARTLGLDRSTVRRFARAATVDELLAPTLDRASKIDDFKDYLHRRWNEGITNASTLTKEITAQGYTGSVLTVRRYVRRFRGPRPTPAPTTPTPPSVRQATCWLMTRPDRLDPDDATTLTAILDHCPDLARLAAHVSDFAVMLTQLHGTRLTEWITRVENDTLAPLAAFAHHLRADLTAVTNALTMTYSSGAVEGTVNKVKVLKRQMYGRANLDLLRKRILLT